MKKSTIQEIEKRFDQDVERFSNLETGQATTLDARLNMELITDCIAHIYPHKINILDIGCGAGNYSVCLLQKQNQANITLVDLSMPMLQKAQERTATLCQGEQTIIKGDFRSVVLPENSQDVIIATAVLHHLRDDQDWANAFSKIYTWLKPGGSLWVFDLVEQSTSKIQHLLYNTRYAQYLTQLKDEAYQKNVFDYIEQEDSPRPLLYQVDLLKKTGFSEIDILHKNLCFASYVAFK